MGRNIFLITSLSLILCISCSGKGGDPVTSDISRATQIFAPSIEIFGPGTSGTEFIEDLQPFYHDIDLGQLAVLGTGNETSQGHGCVAVTLNRDNQANGNDLFKPVLRWLDASTPANPSAGSDPIWVADREVDEFAWNDQFEYRAPAVAAIYVPAGYDYIDPIWQDPAIEVIVCYSYRNSTIGNSVWQIGVTALH